MSGMKRMVHGTSIYFLLGLSFWLWSCSKTPTEILDKPLAPILLPTPPDTALIEIGIDAVERGDFIQLDWKPADNEKPAAYFLYRRDKSQQTFARLIELSGNKTTYLDSSNIKTGQRYYYYLTAVNDDDIESEPSDTLSYLLVKKAFMLSNTLQPVPTFSWQVITHPEFYVLKLLEADTDRKIWVTRVQSAYSQTEQVTYNSDSTAALDSLQSGIAYKWRIDIIGSSRNSGSESFWKQFVIQ